MKVPEKAKQVFKGTIFSVYQWEQEMFDGSQATFEMLKRPNTIQVIATQGDKILLTRQSQPHKHDYYALYGGRAEEGEDPFVTAKRELLEESGLTSDDWELYKVSSPYAKIEWEIYYFIARNCQKTAKPHLDPGEKIEEIVCSFDEFQKFVEEDNYLAKELALDFFRMQKTGTLTAFKQKLFGVQEEQAA